MAKSDKIAGFPGRAGDISTSDDELIESVLNELQLLAITLCSIAMPPERRERIAEAVTLLEGCAGIYKNRRGEKLIWHDAANSR